MDNVKRFVYGGVDLSELTDHIAYRCMDKLNNKQKLTKKEKFELTEEMEVDGIIKVEGWQFDFRPYLHYYWVKYCYGGIYEHWAFNRTYLLNKIGASRIEKIISLKK